eukprot:1160714-Pelagomonas_calceolata.AAC.24
MEAGKMLALSAMDPQHAVEQANGIQHHHVHKRPTPPYTTLNPGHGPMPFHARACSTKAPQ